MEMQMNKESFYDSIVNVRSKRKAQREYSEGFLYLHEAIIVKVINGENFDVGNMDLSKFTDDDLSEYTKYYSDEVEPKLNTLAALLGMVKKAAGVFSEKRIY